MIKMSMCRFHHTLLSANTEMTKEFMSPLTFDELCEQDTLQEISDGDESRPADLHHVSITDGDMVEIWFSSFSAPAVS